MSAEALGSRLAEEVKEESLAEVLSTLRSLYHSKISQIRSPPSAILGIPVLDHLLNNGPALQPHQPAVHLQGPTSSGKTSLIYYLSAILVLPDQLTTFSDDQDGSIPLHGCNSAVIILDTDGRFSALRLQQIMKGYITQTIETATSSGRAGQRSPSGPDSDPRPPSLDPASLTSAVSNLITSSLQHIHILRATSTASLHATLENSLLPYLLHDSHPSQHRPIGGIVLDSADAFVWQDRLDAPNKTNTAGDSSAQAVPTMRSLLQSLQRRLSVPLLMLSSTGALQYPRAGDVVIRLERVSVPKFGPGMSVEEAERDREQRAEVVRRGMFAGGVSVWGPGSGDGGGTGGLMPDILRGAEHQGLGDSSLASAFRFWIRREGVGVLKQ